MTNIIHETAYQLTAYERFGTVGADELREMQIDQLEINEEVIAKYISYQAENGYDYIVTDIADLLEGTDPVEAARMIFFGDVKNWNDDYFRPNRYGNIESLSEWQLIEEIKNDRDFLTWYIDHRELTDVDELADDIITECNKLIAQGY